MAIYNHRKRSHLHKDSDRSVTNLYSILRCLRRGRQKLEMPIFSLTPPMSFCARVSRFLDSLFSVKIAVLLYPVANGIWTSVLIRVLIGGVASH
jgi:hypothetical protein